MAFTLRAAPGRSATFQVEPRIESGRGAPYGLDYNEVFVDPGSGAVLGRRFAGLPALDKRHLMPFLYRLHTSAMLPAAWSHVVFGAVALSLLWQAASGFYLTLPRPRLVPRRSTPLELHRVVGVWAAVLLVVIAITGLGLQLGQPIVRPLMQKLFTLRPSVFDTRAVRASTDPPVSLADAITSGEREASRHGWANPASSAVYLPALDLYGIRFHPPSHDDGEWGFGVPVLYFDGHSGEKAGEKVPRAGGAADVFVDALFPIHSGLVGGTSGRCIVAIVGLAIVILGVTGVIAWRRRLTLG